MTTTPTKARKTAPRKATKAAWSPARPGDTPGQIPPGQDDPNAVPAQDSGPVPMVAGTFAIYQAPDGGMVLVMDVSGGSETGEGRLPTGPNRMKVPAPIVRAALAMAKSGKKPGLGTLRSLISRTDG